MYSYIYGLGDPITKEIRYIGKAENPKKRLREHLSARELDSMTYKNHWLKSLLKQDLIPDLVIIEKVDSENWQDREKYWIKYYKDLLRLNLTNLTEGGEGISNPSKETRLKISMSNKRRGPVTKGFRHTKESKNKISLANLGNTVNVGRIQSEETKRKISLANQRKLISNKTGYKGVYFRPESGKWIATIVHKGISNHLGYFNTKEKAAKAYDKKALEFFGPNCYLNFPLGGSFNVV